MAALYPPGTNEGTRFLEPSLDLTLTIPSTARSVISVGAYDVFYNSYASFSPAEGEI